MSQNQNGSKMPQRRPYRTQASPYRLNSKPAATAKPGEKPPEEAAFRRRAIKFPGLPQRQRAAEIQPKGGQYDADPNRRILKDRLFDERVIKFYRRSKWHIFYLSAIPAFLTLMTVIAFFFTALLPILSFLSIPLLIITLGWWAWTIIDWENDYLILSNKRFVHIEKIFLFEQTRDEIRSVDFTEVKLESKRGSLEFAFQIGTIVIQGKGGSITFNRLPKPDKVYQEIDQDYKERRKARRKERDEFMDKYFISKAQNKTPERIPYSLDIEHHTEKSSFLARVFSGKPMLSLDEMKRQQLVWHKHPFILIKAELMPLGLALLYILGLIFGLPLLALISGAAFAIGIPVALILAAVIAAMLWYKFDDWQNDVYILNTEEVVDSEKLPFGFNEFKDRIKLANVQEIQLSKPGFFANIFNYGSVQVSRTGGNKALTFTNIANPDAVQMQIGRWKDTRQEIFESFEDERQVDFLIRHRHNLRQLLEE